MIGDVSIRGRIERFNGIIWEPIELEEVTVIEPIGELDGFAFVLLGDVPVRYMIDAENTFVEVSREELLFA